MAPSAASFIQTPTTMDIRPASLIRLARTGQKDRDQRGGVLQDSTEFMGDPLTPGVGATPDAKRLL